MKKDLQQIAANEESYNGFMPKKDLRKTEDMV